MEIDENTNKVFFLFPQRWPTDKAYYIAKELLMTERTYKKDLDVVNVVSHGNFIIFTDEGPESSFPITRNSDFFVITHFLFYILFVFLLILPISIINIGGLGLNILRGDIINLQEF